MALSVSGSDGVAGDGVMTIACCRLRTRRRTRAGITCSSFASAASATDSTPATAPAAATRRPTATAIASA